MKISSLHSRKNRGFTLVELAIVLAVTGVLFIGLYRLLSGGSAQVKDAAVASQQTQLINAVKSYLGTTSGGSWMAQSTTVGAAQNITLPLPTSANAPDGATNTLCHNAYTANLKSFCDVLPAGFSQSTLNAFGQTYSVQVQVPAVTVANTPPQTYSFMIVTIGGDTISDADGGRISSEIGVDGGFLYSTNICGAPAASTACGAYGAWTAKTTGAAPAFGFAATASGHVVSRTYYSPETGSTLPWLARHPFGDTTVGSTVSPDYATMTWDLFMGGHNLYFNANNAEPSAPLGIGPFFHLQGGKIYDSASNGDAINLSPSSSYLVNTVSNPLETLTTRCSTVTTVTYGAGKADCQAALQINGDENVIGQLNANTLFAGTFIYQTSDARLKKDIAPITHGLDDLMRVKPVSFTFKAGGQKSLGVIAQELETVYPQLVTEKPDGMKSVNYDGLVAPLIQAVQELKQQNDALRSQLELQGKRQDILEKALKQKSSAP